MKFKVIDGDGEFKSFVCNGTELINYCRELRGNNSNTEYPNPKNSSEAIRYLDEYCNIEVVKLIELN